MGQFPNQGYSPKKTPTNLIPKCKHSRIRETLAPSRPDQEEEEEEEDDAFSLVAVIVIVADDDERCVGGGGMGGGGKLLDHPLPEI